MGFAPGLERGIDMGPRHQSHEPPLMPSSLYTAPSHLLCIILQIQWEPPLDSSVALTWVNGINYTSAEVEEQATLLSSLFGCRVSR
jgi:hypothetical protein